MQLIKTPPTNIFTWGTTIVINKYIQGVYNVLDLCHFVVTSLSPINVLSKSPILRYNKFSTGTSCGAEQQYMRKTYIYIRPLYVLHWIGLVYVSFFFRNILPFIMVPKRKSDFLDVFMS